MESLRPLVLKEINEIQVFNWKIERITKQSLKKLMEMGVKKFDAEVFCVFVSTSTISPYLN